MTDSYPALKEIFDRDRFQALAAEVAVISPGFDSRRFLALATDGLDGLGIMDRMRRTATSLQAALPGDFPTQLAALEALAPRIGHNFVAIALPEYVALYGLKNPARSLAALRFFTRFGSAEFAIRHFLLQDLAGTLAAMRAWAEDPDEHVRRLASEGARPRLPWSFRLPALVADPSLAFPILDRLKADSSAYVRKSVANHLNDISKDHPDWLLDRLAEWDRTVPATAWIVRQALRTLVKRGDPRALALIGATGPAAIAPVRLTVTPASLPLGSTIALAAELVSTAPMTQRLVVDYAVHYARPGGRTARKVFKLKELTLAAGAADSIAVRQTIRDFSTRRHHPGLHLVELVVNGAVVATSDFTLLPPR